MAQRPGLRSSQLRAQSSDRRAQIRRAKDCARRRWRPVRMPTRTPASPRRSCMMPHAQQRRRCKSRRSCGGVSRAVCSGWPAAVSAAQARCVAAQGACSRHAPPAGAGPNAGPGAWHPDRPWPWRQSAAVAEVRQGGLTWVRPASQPASAWRPAAHPASNSALPLRPLDAPPHQAAGRSTAPLAALACLPIPALRKRRPARSQTLVTRHANPGGRRFHPVSPPDSLQPACATALPSSARGLLPPAHRFRLLPRA